MDNESSLRLKVEKNKTLLQDNCNWAPKNGEVGLIFQLPDLYQLAQLNKRTTDSQSRLEVLPLPLKATILLPLQPVLVVALSSRSPPEINYIISETLSNVNINNCPE